MHARTDEDIDVALSSLPGVQAGALVIGTDPFFTSRTEKLGAMSLRLAIPAIYQYRAFSRGRWRNELRRQYHQFIPPCWSLCRTHSQGRKARRSASATVHESGAVFNLKSAKELGITRSTFAARPRRRGDRVMSPVGPNAKCRSGREWPAVAVAGRDGEEVNRRA